MLSHSVVSAVAFRERTYGLSSTHPPIPSFKIVIKIQIDPGNSSEMNLVSSISACIPWSVDIFFAKLVMDTHLLMPAGSSFVMN
jgi:hypothetical protein